MKFLKKILIYISGLYILFIIFILYGGLVNYFAKQDDNPNLRLKKLRPIVIYLSEFPFTAYRSIREKFDGYHEFRVKNNNDFIEQKIENKKFFNKKYYILTSIYNLDKKRSEIYLLDCLNKTILHKWTPNSEKIYKNLIDSDLKSFEYKRETYFKPERILFNSPILTQNKNVIFNTSGSLVRIDSESNILWQNNKEFHHSIERGFNKQNIWVPLRNDFDGSYKNLHKNFIDDGFAKIDVKTGQILFKRSLTQILEKNNLSYFYKNKNYGYDPLHINDVEEAQFDGVEWKKGDLFISANEPSTIFLYRPDEDKLIWFKQGPWSAQHDIDILSEYEISIYDNNLNNESKPDPFNRVVIYNFKENSTSFPNYQLFKEYKIDSETQSLHSIKDDILFVEEQNESNLFIFHMEKNLLLWKLTHNSKIQWSKIYSEDELKNFGFSL